MNIKRELITKGFVLAGLMNILGVLTFSKFFNNPVIPEFDGEAMSNFGLLMIVVWGFVFITVSKNYEKFPWLVGVFIFEKLIYALHWTNWMMHNNVSAIFEKDKLAGIYLAVYGINDWLFFLFFMLVFIQLIQAKQLR